MAVCNTQKIVGNDFNSIIGSIPFESRVSNSQKLINRGQKR